MRTASGLMYSEQALSRGNAARSSRRTRCPARARSVATALPAGPAPATSTSTAPASGEREIFGAIGCLAAADDHRDRDQEQGQRQAHAAQARAAAAKVAAKLTPSLSSHENPPR